MLPTDLAEHPDRCGWRASGKRNLRKRGLSAVAFLMRLACLVLR